MAFAWLLCHRLARAVHAKRVRDIRPCRICHLDYMPPSAFPDLTDREREILGMIVLSGRSNAEIAEELVLSPKTVSNHALQHASASYRLLTAPRRCYAPGKRGWGEDERGANTGLS